MSKLISFLIAISMFFYVMFSYGFVAFKAYWWFVKPITHLAPSISYFEMVGLLMFLVTINMKHTKNRLSERHYIEIALLPWVTLGLCWMVKMIVS